MTKEELKQDIERILADEEVYVYQLLYVIAEFFGTLAEGYGKDSSAIIHRKMQKKIAGYAKNLEPFEDELTEGNLAGLDEE